MTLLCGRGWVLCLAAGRRLAPGVEQEARERGAVAVGMKRLAPTDQLADALEVVEERELPRRVIPLAGVVARDPRGQGGERLDLRSILPPVLARPDAVALGQSDHVGPELLPPQPPLAREQMGVSHRPTLLYRELVVLVF